MAEVKNGVLVEKWDLADIKFRCPQLTEKQALKVLDYISENYDSGVGINWGIVDAAAAVISKSESTVTYRQLIELLKNLPEELLDRPAVAFLEDCGDFFEIEKLCFSDNSDNLIVNTPYLYLG